MFGTLEHKVLLDVVGEVNTKICCTVIGWLFRLELNVPLEWAFPAISDACFHWVEFVVVAGSTSVVAAFLEVKLKALRADLDTRMIRRDERDRMEDRLQMIEAINRSLPLVPTWSFKEIVEEHTGVVDDHVAMYAILVLTLCALLVSMLQPSAAFTERRPVLAAFRKVYANSFALGAAFACNEVPKTMVELILGSHSTHLIVLAFLAPAVTLGVIIVNDMLTKLEVPEEEHFCHAFIMFLTSAGKFIVAWQWAALADKLEGYMLAEVGGSCSVSTMVNLFWAMVWLDLGTLIAWRAALGCGWKPKFEYELKQLHVSGGSALAVLVVGIGVGWSVTSVMKAAHECWAADVQFRAASCVMGWVVIFGVSVLMVMVQHALESQKTALEDADEDVDGKPAP